MPGKRTRKPKVPHLPSLLKSKIYKTGQTRGADDDDVYQNRVNRNGTVLIPYKFFDTASTPPEGDQSFENGFIVLISPSDYFSDPDITTKLAAKGLELGLNTLIFYQTRKDWDAFNPDKYGFKPGDSRKPPLDGQFVARVAGTTQDSDEGEKLAIGYSRKKLKGAGIRVFEYATSDMIARCRTQLECIYWSCFNAEEIAVAAGMEKEDVTKRRDYIFEQAEQLELWDLDRLKSARIIDAEGNAICPLCLDKLSALSFFSKEEQAEGRGVHNLTVTQVSLFHIGELRIGKYEHREYNLGWGHHHCNTVVKDAGITKTVEWMKSVIERNEAYDHS